MDDAGLVDELETRALNKHFHSLAPRVLIPIDDE
jgi:hypothetical protein